MAGLDKIIEEILNDGRVQAKEKTDAAAKQADEIREQARAEADQLAKEMKAKAEAEKARAIERANSSGDMQARQKALLAKQELITAVLEEAYQKILNMDENSYFAFLEKLADQHALSKDGLLYLNEKDKDRMPAGFEEKIKEAAAGKGGALRIADEPKAIDGGFILVYGGIEENCSLSALFRDKRDELADLAGSVLFA